ncbi:hypothetical protein AB0J80_22855 [Actinoplanes sp. NPDC049548]|uniref:hypothetical protein n=1 Tax=Actinoplanes sp. NPDC049548 TaxID=3155152 RepID=UPI003435D54B
MVATRGWYWVFTTFVATPEPDNDLLRGQAFLAWRDAGGGVVKSLTVLPDGEVTGDLAAFGMAEIQRNIAKFVLGADRPFS